MTAIQALPDADTRTDHHLSSGKHCNVGAMIDVAISGRKLHLMAEIKREAFPRDVRELLWQFRNRVAHSNGAGDEVISFLAARSISRGARDLLGDERLGFYD